MDEYIPSIGDRSYVYSILLDEIIIGIIEGFDDNKKCKVLQEVSDEGYLRHIVSRAYVYSTYEEALACKEEMSAIRNKEISVGNVVYLLDIQKNPVSYKDSVPLEYQVVSIYRDTQKIGLVTSYGEYIGLHALSDVLYVRDLPIFFKEDYEVGTHVVWLEGEEVYEGIIEHLYDTTAKVGNVKKLLSIDKKVRVPYWKIPEGRKSIKDSTPVVLHTIIGDDLD